MRRSILMSILAIGAAIAVVTGASTFATFTDTSTVNTTALAAGTVRLKVNTLDGPGASQTVAYTGGTCTAPTNLAYGDQCTLTLNVQNSGSLKEDVSFSGAPSANTNGCYSFTDPTSLGTFSNVAAGASIPTQTLTVTLNNPLAPGQPDNACQSAQFAWTITVNGAQSGGQ